MSETVTRTREETKQVASEAAEKGMAVAQTAQEQAAQVVGDARQQVGEVAQEARTQVRNVVGDAKTQLHEQVNTQASRLAETLNSLTGELRALSQGQPDQATNIRQYVDEASSKVEQLARRVEERGFDGLVDDVQRFARRRPGAFLLGAGVAGFLAGRVLRTTRDDGSGGSQFTGGYDPYRYAAQPAQASDARLATSAQPQVPQEYEYGKEFQQEPGQLPYDPSAGASDTGLRVSETTSIARPGEVGGTREGW